MISKINLVAYCTITSCSREGNCIAPDNDARAFYNNVRICPYLGFHIEEAD